MKIVPLQPFSPVSPNLITEEIFTCTIADVVKVFDIEELIKYLQKKDLKLKFFAKKNCRS